MNVHNVRMGRASVVLALLLTGVTLVSAHANQPQTEAAQASVVASGSLSPLAARFVETRREPDHPASGSDWYFVRSDARIQTTQQDYAEVWERDERGEITWTRVFHGDQKVIEYTTGELRAQRRIRDWTDLATIVDRQTLSRLEKRGTTTVLERPAVRYVGRLGDEQVVVVWLPQEAIPAKLVRKQGGVTHILELKELRAAPDSSWPTRTLEQTDAYERVDAADLGDRESEPFVRKVLALDAGTGRHSHAH
ncbi:MAG: hypothetical protein ACOYXU_06550 [Nitrospirota bacterium]